jgi:hypothetical protein
MWFVPEQLVERSVWLMVTMFKLSVQVAGALFFTM